MWVTRHGSDLARILPHVLPAQRVYRSSSVLARCSMSEEPGREEEVEGLEGRYANYFRVGHNAFEFLLDFGQFYSERNQLLLHTRVVTTPAYAKVLSATILESLDRYEQSYGPIPRADDDMA